ncbi:piggyBac transposable element-derived protein 4 [Caerostris darwini]|uniref:PiggyBac transposable element-derived protein 4 n=1 Tax=Caerostris darwini TaxID=1538125 RepID=A0AAV4W369_9ARAC|nr:piggyBac transposable element-derived protein 4 [Caerostris darwini]
MEQFPFIKSECLLQPVTGDNPIDYFRHLFTENMLDEVIAQTNNYAREVLCRRETKQHSRINAWKETTKEEILIFVGLILHMGIIRINRIEDYWKTDALFGLSVFSYNMSRNRFNVLLRALNFSKIPEQDAEPSKDQLYKIRSMVNLFNTRLAEIYYPGREISLDEAMILLRGRLMFKQYIPDRCQKYAIKLYMITTPDGMVIKFMVHSGMVDDSGGKGHAQKVVLNLLEGMLDVGHSVYMDNYYSSYELAKCLADRKTHCTGTIEKNRNTFPKEVIEKNLKKGETVAMYANGVMIGKWKDKRDIIYISNEYKNDIVEKTYKRGERKSKPLPVIQYNKYMAGIDKQDQMLAYYPCERKTIRWPTKIFVHILQLMISNSHFLYNKYSTQNISLYDFRLSVIRCLLKPQPVLCVPKHNSPELEHVLKPRDEKRNGKILRKQCKRCYSQGKRKDTIYICKVCDDSPGYCLDCAKVIHK